MKSFLEHLNFKKLLLFYLRRNLATTIEKENSMHSGRVEKLTNWMQVTIESNLVCVDVCLKPRVQTKHVIC